MKSWDKKARRYDNLLGWPLLIAITIVCFFLRQRLNEKQAEILQKGSLTKAYVSSSYFIKGDYRISVEYRHRGKSYFATGYAPHAYHQGDSIPVKVLMKYDDVVIIQDPDTIHQ